MKGKTPDAYHSGAHYRQQDGNEVLVHEQLNGDELWIYVKIDQLAGMSGKIDEKMRTQGPRTDLWRISYFA